MATGTEVLNDPAVSASRTGHWRDAPGVIAELGTRLVLRLPPGRVLVDLARSHPEPVGASSVDVRTKARL